MVERYVVQVDFHGCDHCANGRTWFVIDDETQVAGGTSYGIEEEAIDVAALMNEAFNAGIETARKSIAEG